MMLKRLIASAGLVVMTTACASHSVERPGLSRLNDEQIRRSVIGKYIQVDRARSSLQLSIQLFEIFEPDGVYRRLSDSGSSQGTYSLHDGRLCWRVLEPLVQNCYYYFIDVTGSYLRQLADEPGAAERILISDRRD